MVLLLAGKSRRGLATVVVLVVVVVVEGRTKDLWGVVKALAETLEETKTRKQSVTR